MHRSQDQRSLTHDEYGGTLEPCIQRHRLKGFYYFGATTADMHMQCRRGDPTKMLDYLDETRLYLGRYAHVSASDFEAMELLEVERYVKQISRLLYAEHGKDEYGNPVKKTTTTDRPPS